MLLTWYLSVLFIRRLLLSCVSVVQPLLVATSSVSCVKKEMGEGSHSLELVWTVTTCVVTVWTTWNTQLTHQDVCIRNSVRQ